MRKIALILAAALTFGLSGCLAGPHQLRRTVDDFDQKLYVNSPLVDGVLWVVPVIPLANFVAGIGDFFVVDAYSFWVKDVWEGKGTGFKHFEPAATRSMKSLMLDDGKFLEIK